MTSVSSKARLLIGAATGLVIGTTQAAAQTAAPAELPAQAAPADPVPAGSPQAATDQTTVPTPATAEAAVPAEANANEIVVTGTRIARSQFDQPNPITSFDAAAIEQSGRTNVTDFLTRVPALVGSFTAHDEAGSNVGNPGDAGQNFLNLRNLGANRTLILVDGRRHVATQAGTAAVDINTIPTDLIERIDTETGGASAIYGADGVSGVVNFILKRDFQGVSARAQLGISKYGDAANRFVSVTAGHNFADGRGNLTLAYEYDADQRVQESDRKRLTSGNRDVLVQNPNDLADNPNVPDQIFLRDIRYADSSPYGAIDTNGDYVPDFTGTGKVYDRGTILPRSGGLTQGGDSTPTEGYQGDLQPRLRRHTVNAFAHYDFSDALKLSLEGKFVDAHSFTIEQPTFDYYIDIAPDNPFVPANIAAAAAANGVDATVTRDNFDFGIRGEQDIRKTYRGVADASGRISENATYDLYYEYGRTRSSITATNDRLGDRFFAAVDAVTDPATGAPTCRSNIDPNASFVIDPTTFTPGANSGCSPVNLFGYGSPSQASLDFFTVDHTSTATIQEHVVDGSISGDFGQFFSLPGGPIGFAIGGEYRREGSNYVPDQYLQNGEIYDSSQISPVKGHYDVKEFFSELNAPILKDVPFAKLLSFGAALRFSDYSTVGHNKTWQVNGIYAPVTDISFRGSYSQAVRAPNIGELYQPTSGTYAFFNDPCDVTNLNNGTGSRAANCATILSKIGIDPSSFSPLSDPQSSVSIEGTSAGNPSLAAETARTWTAGVVLRPRFLPGLTASVDWYNIRLKNAINTPSPQRIAELCVDAASTDNPYCGSITRDPATGFINGFAVAPQNVAAFKTAGADLNLDYVFRTGRLGTFNVRLVGGYLNKLTFVPTPGDTPENELNVFGTDTNGNGAAPKWTANMDLTWTLGKATLSYDLNWTSRTRRFSRLTTAGDPDYTASKFLFIKDYWNHDLQLNYDFEGGLSLYAGVNNLLDSKPAIGLADYPNGAIGRYMYAGAKLKLPNLF